MMYIIKIENKEQFDEVVKYFKRRMSYVDYLCSFILINNGNIQNQTSFQNYTVPNYTFNEWKLKFMKTNKTYICPFDLAEGMVTKGTVYKRYKEGLFYSPNGEESPYTLPQEIVEKWEEAPEFKVGDYVFTHDGNVLGQVSYAGACIRVIWSSSPFVSTYKPSELRLATEREIKEARRYQIEKDKNIYIFKDKIQFYDTFYKLDFLENCFVLSLNEEVNCITLLGKLNNTNYLLTLRENNLRDILTKMKQW